MSELDSFGAWLERQLRRSRVSQAELAAALNMTRAGVSAWVNNRAMPRADRLRSIEEFFGLVPGAATSLQDAEKGLLSAFGTTDVRMQTVGGSSAMLPPSPSRPISALSPEKPPRTVSMSDWTPHVLFGCVTHFTS